jgi:hypothetical protein
MLTQDLIFEGQTIFKFKFWANIIFQTHGGAGE